MYVSCKTKHPVIYWEVTLINRATGFQEKIEVSGATMKSAFEVINDIVDPIKYAVLMIRPWSFYGDENDE